MRLYGQAFIDDDIPQIITISTNPFKYDCFYTDFEKGELSMYVNGDWNPYNTFISIPDIYYDSEFSIDSNREELFGTASIYFEEGKVIKGKFMYYESGKEIEVPCDIIIKHLSLLLKEYSICYG